MTNLPSERLHDLAGREVVGELHPVGDPGCLPRRKDEEADDRPDALGREGGGARRSDGSPGGMLRGRHLHRREDQHGRPRHEIPRHHVHLHGGQARICLLLTCL